MGRSAGEVKLLGFFAVASAAVLAVVGLQRYAERPPAPLDRVEEIRFFYGPRGRLEVVLCRDHARELVAGAVKHRDLDRCPCPDSRPVEVSTGSVTYSARVCPHCLSLASPHGDRCFRMTGAFHARYAAHCDSLLVPVPGATDLRYAPAHEPAARRALVLMQDRLARLGAPVSISSEDGVVFHYLLREPKPSVVGDHGYRVDTSTGEVRANPRM